MIRLLPPGGPPPCPEPLTGCRIQALAGCYGSMQNALEARLYQSGEGGVLCLFGETLHLSGPADPDELAGFAAMLGVTRIEGVESSFRPPDGWRVGRYPALSRTPAEALQEEPIPAAAPDQLRRVFALLCEGDPAFAARCDRLAWLSDLTRRRNRGRAQVYILEDQATACLSAIGEETAYLSMVAVSPCMRGRGLGLRLVSLVLADCARRGLCVFTAAQGPALVPFYQKAGFQLLERPLLVATASQSLAGPTPGQFDR